MKGIAPVIAVVLLAMVTVAIVGLVYAFLSGFQSTATSKVAFIRGDSLCNPDGYTTIVVTNVGTAPLLPGDFEIARQRCMATNGRICTNDLGDFDIPQEIGVGLSGMLNETDTDPCGPLATCDYRISIAGIMYITRAYCL